MDDRGGLNRNSSSFPGQEQLLSPHFEAYNTMLPALGLNEKHWTFFIKQILYSASSSVIYNCLFIRVLDAVVPGILLSIA